MGTFSKIKSTNKKNIWVQIQINFKKYGHKKKLIYGYKLKLKRKLVQIKKELQIKNGYKLKLKIYDKKFSHKYKYLIVTFLTLNEYI